MEVLSFGRIKQIYSLISNNITKLQIDVYGGGLNIEEIDVRLSDLIDSIYRDIMAIFAAPNNGFDLVKFKSGMTGRRSDWGYAKEVYISLLPLPNNPDCFGFYISNTLLVDKYDLIGYGITYDDMMSDKWEYV